MYCIKCGNFMEQVYDPLLGIMYVCDICHYMTHENC